MENLVGKECIILFLLLNYISKSSEQYLHLASYYKTANTLKKNSM